VSHASPTLTIRGNNFGTYDNTLSASVICNSVDLESPAIQYVSDTQVLLLLKPNSCGSLTVVLTIGNQLATFADAFSYHPPAISSLLPASPSGSGRSPTTAFAATSVRYSRVFLFCLALILCVV
jgi:hypothetical protein